MKSIPTRDHRYSPFAFAHTAAALHAAGAAVIDARLQRLPGPGATMTKTRTKRGWRGR